MSVRCPEVHSPRIDFNFFNVFYVGTRPACFRSTHLGLEEVERVEVVEDDGYQDVRVHGRRQRSRAWKLKPWDGATAGKQLR